MKFLSIIGTRPNIIKLAPVHRTIIARGHEHVILHTGQHYDDNMSGNLFKEFELPEPDYNLETHRSTLTHELADLMIPIIGILNAEEPDVVLIYGDVVSSLAGALVAVQNHYPVAHIEAGVRNNDMRITEHFNRVIIDRISQLNFCATHADHQNLLAENLGRTSWIVGDVMKDLFLELAPTRPKEGKHILLTLHRPENVDDPERFRTIIKALEKIDEEIIWPIHPRSRNALNKMGITPDARIKVIPPQSYKRTIELIWDSKLIITDSGGLQKEAYFANRPCIVIFQDVVWPEIFETGNQIIVRDNLKELPMLARAFRGSIKHPNLFGFGDAAQRIIQAIEDIDMHELFKQ